MFDRYTERVKAGERLSVEELAELANAPDILGLGMLADVSRRHLHGSRATFLRVATCPFDQSFSDAVPPGARDVRMAGAPATIDIALTAVRSAKAIAGERTVSGFSWADVQRLSHAADAPVAHVLEQLRSAGLDALTEIPMDRTEDVSAAVEQLAAAGFRQLRLTIDNIAASQRTVLFAHAAALQDRFGCIQALNPLPLVLNAFRPTTGYEDVKMVAIARLAAPNITTVQVDWLRYGPKLAQVALTFGADDLDNVSPVDEGAEGPRRAPLAEVRRNIEAAGFEPAERDGRFAVIA
jgi:aminodeoxyfutalosine synthase